MPISKAMNILKLIAVDFLVKVKAFSETFSFTDLDVYLQGMQCISKSGG